MKAIKNMDTRTMSDFVRVFNSSFLNKYDKQIRISNDSMHHLHLIYTDMKYNQCLQFTFVGNGFVKVWGLARGECFGYYTQEFKVDTPREEMIKSIEYIFGFKLDF